MLPTFPVKQRYTNANFAHACAANYNIPKPGSDGKTPYFRDFGDQPTQRGTFIPRDFCFRPSPTIRSCTLPKAAGRLIPGLFLDYYTPRAGQLSGQFIVCPLADFDGCPLQLSTPTSAFKLRLNRAEVIKRKPNCVWYRFPR